MKSIICEQPNLFRTEEVEMPIPKATEALIRVRRIGVCGTDLHAYRGKQPFFSYPRILGHEIAGEIVQIEEDSELRIGDQVAVIPYISCGTCIACRKGKENSCVSLQVLGVHIDGGMREYMKVPKKQLIKTESLTLDQIAMVEPFSIGLHAVNRGQVQSGENVLVIGAGPIGLSVMKFAKLAGARVIAMDLNLSRLAFCKSWASVDEIIEASSDVMNRLAELTDGEFPTTVIDATGHAPSMMNTIGYAAAGGKVVFVSLVQADITFHDPEFHKKELTLLGSRAATREEFAYVIDCMQDGQIDITPYITHRATLDEMTNEFENWLDPKNGVIKAVITL
ncbi:zinc-binding alcohol dehydrogenase family protein [Paenibacillus yanchengensis]|uniref:Zinc-binding alcohol dehydrogenase family protein n=1 Tax=Paenibacillus yanchengensis TaxID=2035833 RepID=A0ABW4YQG5_9BACL